MSKAKSRNTDSMLKLLIKEAMEIILQGCHHQGLLPTKLSRHIDSTLSKKPTFNAQSHTHLIPRIRCRNIRTLLYYARNLFC